MFIVLEECSYKGKDWFVDKWHFSNSVGEVIKENSFIKGPVQTMEEAIDLLRKIKQGMIEDEMFPYIEYETNKLSCNARQDVITYSDFSICKLEPVCPETN
jgi:hypothetical protein